MWPSDRPDVTTFQGATPDSGQGLLIIETSLLFLDASHSVGLLWTSNQPGAETSTRKNTTHTGERLPCTMRDSNL
jgi:hypothetical protein